MRGSQVAPPTLRGDICGPLNWGQHFSSQKWNEAMRLERGHCHWWVADFYNLEQKLKAFSLPHLLPHHISFHKATNSGWLSLNAQLHSSKFAFVQENRELFSLPYQPPRKGERSVWPAICALLGDNETLKAGETATQTHRVSARTREGGYKGGALLSLLKT